MPDDSIPYDDYKLREAYRRGREAWLKGQPPPDDDRFEDDEIRRAFLDGYESRGEA